MILLTILLKKERERKELDLIKLDISVFWNVLSERIAEWKLCVCVTGRAGSSVERLCSFLISTWKDAIFYLLRPDMESQVSNHGLSAYCCGYPCLAWVLFFNVPGRTGWIRMCEWKEVLVKQGEAGSSLVPPLVCGEAQRYRHPWQEVITNVPGVAGNSWGHHQPDWDLQRQVTFWRVVLEISLEVTCCCFPHGFIKHPHMWICIWIWCECLILSGLSSESSRGVDVGCRAED